MTKAARIRELLATTDLSNSEIAELCVATPQWVGKQRAKLALKTRETDHESRIRALEQGLRDTRATLNALLRLANSRPTAPIFRHGARAVLRIKSGETSAVPGET